MARTQEPKLDPAQPYRSAMRQLIGVRFAELWRAMPAAVAGDDGEGVHDVRVASRRLRAAMDVAVECFPAKWYRPLHELAKDVTGSLGEVRDRDVLLEFLAKEREGVAPGEHPGIDRLIERVTRERDEARKHMLAFLAGLEARHATAETVKRFGAGPAPRPADEHGAPA